MQITIERTPFGRAIRQFVQQNGQKSDLLPALQERLDPRSIWMAARLGKSIVGIAGLSMDQEMVRVTDLCVAPLWRRKGIGTSLLGRCVQEARIAARSRVVVSGIDSRNMEGRRFLESRGFTILNDYVRMEWVPQTLPDVSLPNGYEVRTFREGDEQAWAECINRAYSTQRDKTNWTSQSVREKFVNTPSFMPDGTFFVLREGRMVGTFIAWREVEAGARRGRLHWLGVDPDHRNKGIATFLTVTVIRYLLSRGLDSVFLDTSYSLPVAMGIYRKLGFLETPRLFDYFKDLAQTPSST